MFDASVIIEVTTRKINSSILGIGAVSNVNQDVAGSTALHYTRLIINLCIVGIESSSTNASIIGERVGVRVACSNLKTNRTGSTGSSQDGVIESDGEILIGAIIGTTTYSIIVSKNTVTLINQISVGGGRID